MDKKTNYKYGLLPLFHSPSKPLDAGVPLPQPKISLSIIRQQIILATPIVLQSVVGIGSWFIFFVFIEEMDTTGEALAISNVLRTVYLVLMIPAWGFGSAINTIVSNFIGKGQPEGVMLSIRRTTTLCVLVTFLMASSLLIAPNFVLAIATDDALLIEASKRLIWVLMTILVVFSVGAIYFNGMIGTGATSQALIMQSTAVVLYLSYVYFTVKIFLLQPALEWAWMGEFVYWGVTLLLAVVYLRSARWKAIRV